MTADNLTLADELSVPIDVSDITPAWLTSVMALAFPGAQVASLTTEVLHDGTAFTCRLNITYKPGSAAGPGTLVLKSGMDAPHRDVVFKSALCVKEAMVYRDVLPKTQAKVAQCYASAFEREGGKGFVLLEDLKPRGVTFCKAEEPLTVEQVAVGLEQLAELHAVLWKSAELQEPRWRHRGRALGELDPLEALFLDMIPTVAKTPHAGAISHIFHDPKVIGGAVQRLRKQDDGWANCLIHGDAHLGNFFVDADAKPGMADFQCVQRGHFSHDTSMFIASALDIVDRRRAEQELVRHHVEALEKRVENPPTFEEAWLGYRRHHVYGLWGWFLTTDQFQTELRCVTTCFRFGSAALDHDSLGLINAG